MNEKMKAEERRQAQILAEAIQAVILAKGAEFDVPMLNAVGGALVTVEASMLASIGDPAQRKALKKAMERVRPAALADALSRKRSLHIVPVVVGGRFDA